MELWPCSLKQFETMTSGERVEKRGGGWRDGGMEVGREEGSEGGRQRERGMREDGGDKREESVGRKAGGKM